MAQNDIENMKVELRQQKVFELRLKGLSISRIAEVLNVSNRTVCRDLEIIYKAEKNWVKKQVKSFDRDIYWIERKSEIEFMIRELWVALVEQRTDRATVAKTIIELRNELDKCLKSVGIKTIVVDPDENITDTIRIIHEYPDEDTGKIRLGATRHSD